MSDFLSQLGSGHSSIDISFYVMIAFYVICLFIMIALLKPMSKEDSKYLAPLAVILCVSEIAAFISTLIHVAASVTLDASMSDTQGLIMTLVGVALVATFFFMMSRPFREAKKDN